MPERHDLDEYLERLWHMTEEGTDSLDVLKEKVGEGFNSELMDELESDGLLKQTNVSARVTLTPSGREAARLLVRSHRLAECLLYTVLGKVYENVACEFEHVVIPEIIDSLCAILAHPKECPHGKPIPPGDCCKQAVIAQESVVIPMTHLKVGQTARVAYVKYATDQQFYKIEGMHICRGARIKLLQTSPAYVIECEGANVVLDEKIAAEIVVWKKLSLPTPAEKKEALTKKDVKQNHWLAALSFLGVKV